VKSFVGLPEGPETRVAIVNVPAKKHYLFTGQFSAEEIKSWTQLVIDGKATPFRKTEARPAGDKDPEHPMIYKLVADSFHELVINSKDDFFVDLWADWCGPCVAVAPTIDLLSQVLADLPTIKIGKMDVDENATDADFFPEPTIPNMKFFSNKDKQHPIKYQGNRTLVDFVEFIHKHAATSFDLAEYKTRGEKLQILTATLNKAKKTLKKAEDHFNRHKVALPQAESSSFETASKSLKAELEKTFNATEANLTALTAAVASHGAWSTLDEEERKFKAGEEKKSLKNVTKVHSDDEYDGLIAKAKADEKNIIVDCFATWCGPCVYIGPIFSGLSEKYTKLRFVKIDVDEQRRTAESLGITAMPTFKVIKGGQVVDELVGADPAGLEALCKKYDH